MEIYKVRNPEGQEFDVKAENLSKAAQDNYFPVVSNGTDEFRVNPNKLDVAAQDGFRPILAMKPVEQKSFGQRSQEHGQALVSGMANALTFGYGPELYEKTTGQPASRYEQYSKEVEKRAPLSAKTGEIAGQLMPASKISKGVNAIIKGSSAIPRIAALATEAGLMAGLQKAETNEQKLENALWGVAFGGGTGLAGKGLETVGKGLKEVGKTLRIKGAGAMLKDFRELYGRNAADSMNDFLKRHKLVGFGSTVDSVLEKVKPIREALGRQLDDVYTRVMGRMNNEEFIANLSPEMQDRFLNAGFYPSSQKDDILSVVWNKVKNEEGGEGVLNQVSKYLDQLINQYGDDLTLKQAQQIKTAVDKTINYARNPNTKDPLKEQAFKEVRRFISNKIDDQLKFFDDVVGGKEAKLLKVLNREYGNAASVSNMSADKVARESANRLFGLSEQIASGALGAGALAQDKDPMDAALMALGGFAASRALKTAGPGAGAVMADAVGSGIRTLGKGVSRLRGAAAAQSAETPRKGPGKWANDGYRLIKEHSADFNKPKSKLLENPAAKKLLIEAARYKPGSKGMQRVFEKLQKIEGGK